MAAGTAPRSRTLKIRPDDRVKVITGKDRGKTGRVMRVDPEQRARLRRGPEHGQAPHASAAGPPAPRRRAVGGVIERAGPIHVSNVDADRPQGRQAHPRRASSASDGNARVRVARRSGDETGLIAR